MNEKYLLSISEAQAYSGIGRNKLYELVRADKIATVRIGRNIKVHRMSLEQFLDRTAEERKII
ncbi:helix-turn-helix domain-containing protein [Gudongella oleilytica]|uniref:helix-turn-helix domain-containing protein n=1 Tax=Gudongella oleilytica TaxID=1582259 RepID=UPI002A3684BB|nr:helix-turn-helix domain-containing protein [Gudongella oleilytica]MDY0256786.1 helix-turn-helix domain-containing protein [Gudongella oleilytica]